MKYPFIIFIFIVFTTDLFCQGSYLDVDQSGFGIGAGFVTNKNVSGFGGNVSYSASAVFDFGISVERYGFDEKILGKDLSAVVISPYISFYALKQEEDIPISLSVSASYEWQDYYSDALDNYKIDMSGAFYSIGASLFRYFKPSDSMRIQPSFGITYVSGESRIEEHSGYKQTEDSHTTVYNFSLSIVLFISSNNIFVIRPNVSSSEGINSFGLLATLIIPTN